MITKHRFTFQRARWILGANALIASSALGAPADPSAVLKDAPAAYYRFDDSTFRTNVNVNIGSLGASGNATNLNVRAYPGAVQGDPNFSQFYDSTARAIIPFTPALNPPNTQPFTMEAWIYPASDQINSGEAPIANRYAYSGADRQGWVIFKRAPSDSYAGQPGYEGVGWNFRMYTGVGSGSGLDVTSQTPYQVGKWTHLVVIYDPVTPNDATLSMYVDGTLANTAHWQNDATPGYAANTDNHAPSEAVNGPAGLSFGSYNNTQPGSNPFFGAVDEFAFYTNKLSEQQILSHYQSGTNFARSSSYEALVQSARPVAYLRFGELSRPDNRTLNQGDLRNAGYASNTPEVVLNAGSALAGRTDDHSARYHWRSNSTSRTTIPFQIGNNPPESVPFTFEGWFRPLSDRINPGAAPVNNRYVSSGNRTGWVMFQRAPNDTYAGQSGYEGVGWDFRMYTGVGGGGQDVVTAVPYKVGEWQHLVFTWMPQSDTGNGNWQGTLSAYVNGELVAANENALYKANTETTEDGTPPSDLALGGYNAASKFGNYFEGQIDEVALYNNYLLTTNQIAAHYQAGTNAHPATNYETLVLTAAYEGLTGGDPAPTQRLHPATYLRFNEPVGYPATNSGTLGMLANASIINPGAVGSASWIDLGDPAGLAFTGPITLEAWIKPGATQAETARIISHGPAVVSSFTPEQVTDISGPLTSGEVFLRLDSSGAKYVVGSSDGTNTYSASAAVPAGDLGGTNWVHLVGTYDGSNWKLYRNGVPVATNAAPFGAVKVDGSWAVGATGEGFGDFFAGQIDDVAIYPKALTAAQVQAHYAGTSSGALNIAIARNAGAIAITWSGGVLQEADTITGTFSDLPNATSPYTPPAGARMKFYRVRQ